MGAFYLKGLFLRYFTQNENFPFFIQYGHHDGFMFMHKHEDFSELVIVIDGFATHVIGNERIPISKGDVFYVGTCTAHGYEDAMNLRLYNIMFKPEIAFENKYDLLKIPGFHAMFMQNIDYIINNGFKSLKLTKPNHNSVLQRAENMLSEFNKKSDGWYIMFLAEFLLLIGTISRLYMKLETNKNTPENLANAVAFIENHYTENISIEMLTDISHYSTRQLNRIFNDFYGISPIEYIISLRIREACKLLQNEKLSVSLIASKCGFSSSNYFGRLFKQKMGITPKQFRIQESQKFLNQMDELSQNWII